MSLYSFNSIKHLNIHYIHSFNYSFKNTLYPLIRLYVYKYMKFVQFNYTYKHFLTFTDKLHFIRFFYFNWHPRILTRKFDIFRHVEVAQVLFLHELCFSTSIYPTLPSPRSGARYRVLSHCRSLGTSVRGASPRATPHQTTPRTTHAFTPITPLSNYAAPLTRTER